MPPPLSFELARCREIYNTGILESDSTLTQSALIEILIRLDYVLQTLDEVGKRITFNDDTGNGDITDLIDHMRNAVCHSDSHRNRIGSATLMYNRFAGYCPNAIRIGNVVLGSKYADDTAFNYGDNVLYLKRHIWRLLEELPIALSS